MADIVIIDYGMGNVHSVFKALDKIADKRSHVKISNSLEEIKKSLDQKNIFFFLMKV